MLEGDPCLWGSPSIICWCGSSTNALSEKTINYKLNGNVTSDATNSLQSSYNLLNLPAQIKSGSTVKANYTYLSNGTKAAVFTSASAVKDYAGYFTYSRGNGGSKTLESVAFGGGRMGRRYVLGIFKHTRRGNDDEKKPCHLCFICAFFNSFFCGSQGLLRRALYPLLYSGAKSLY